jgi:hypothetical protein
VRRKKSAISLREDRKVKNDQRCILFSCSERGDYLTISTSLFVEKRTLNRDSRAEGLSQQVEKRKKV